VEGLLSDHTNESRDYLTLPFSGALAENGNPAQAYCCRSDIPAAVGGYYALLVRRIFMLMS